MMADTTNAVTQKEKNTTIADEENRVINFNIANASVDESVNTISSMIKDPEKASKNFIKDNEERFLKVAKDVIGQQSKQDISSLGTKSILALYFFFLLTSAGLFGVFNWVFLVSECSPLTTQIQPFWTDQVYTNAFYTPSAGIYPCQSFFEASVEDCAKVSSLTKKPTTSPAVAPSSSLAPSKQPVSVPGDQVNYCLVPCVLPGIPCHAYGAFNPTACNSVVTSRLTTFYANFSNFDCSIASKISCTSQTYVNSSGAQTKAFNDVPSQITAVYLSCTSVAQSFTNSM
jgi:hypothetical protein